MRCLDKKIRDFACSSSYILLNQQWLRNTIAPKGTKAITVVERKKTAIKGESKSVNIQRDRERGKKDN